MSNDIPPHLLLHREEGDGSASGGAGSNSTPYGFHTSSRVHPDGGRGASTVSAASRYGQDVGTSLSPPPRGPLRSDDHVPAHTPSAAAAADTTATATTADRNAPSTASILTTLSTKSLFTGQVPNPARADTSTGAPNLMHYGTKTPVGLVRTPGGAPLNGENTNTNTSSASAAYPQAASTISHQDTHRIDDQDTNNGVSYSRLNNVKAAAAKDKEMLLLRIEELSSLARQLQGQVKSKDSTLERYQHVLGPLHEFSTKQVQLREEIVTLRDSVRSWQDKEATARKQVQHLQKTIDGLRRSGDHESAESRLADLQERLAFAYLQKNEAESELDKVQDLFHAQQKHNVAMDAAGAGEHNGWRLRGKVADLQLLIKQKSELISSLKKTTEELEAVAKTEAGKSIGAMNRKCPGCSQPQWSSPFCPMNGHRHLGYEGGEDSTAQEQQQGQPTLQGQTSPKPKSANTTFTSAADALASGQWRKLVQIGTFNVSYQHAQTGRIVPDLEEELMRLHKEEEERLAAEAEEQRKQEAAQAASVTPVSKGGGGTKPSLHKEIERLLAQLHKKNDETAKLKALLKTVSASGMVGVPIAQPAAPAASEASSKPGKQGSTTATEASPSPATTAGNTTPPPITLGAEDEAMQPITKIHRLEAENAQLNQRCTELVLQVAKRDDAVRSMQQQLDNIRFDIHGEGNNTKSGNMENQLRTELAATHDALLRERRRVVALEDELKRVSRVL